MNEGLFVLYLLGKPGGFGPLFQAMSRFSIPKLDLIQNDLRRRRGRLFRRSGCQSMYWHDI
jgi:hypothetical protein